MDNMIDYLETLKSFQRRYEDLEKRLNTVREALYNLSEGHRIVFIAPHIITKEGHTVYCHLLGEKFKQELNKKLSNRDEVAGSLEQDVRNVLQDEYDKHFEGLKRLEQKNNEIKKRLEDIIVDMNGK